MRECSLPLTGRRVVNRIITDLGTIDIGAEGLILRELAPGVSVEEIRAATDPSCGSGRADGYGFARLAAARLEIWR